MDAILELVRSSGFASLSWQNLVMFAVGGVLIYLAVAKKYEPLLLIPIGFGAIVANPAAGDHVGRARGDPGPAAPRPPSCRWSTTRASAPSSCRR